MIFNELRLESYTFNKLATPPNISHTGSLLALHPVEMNNYYPFGMIKEGMFAKSGEGYRYGFNGMERDNVTKGFGNDLSTFFRGYDPRLGRWKSVDPVVHHWESPYVGFNNSPKWIVDPMGNSGLNFNNGRYYEINESVCTGSYKDDNGFTHYTMTQYVGDGIFVNYEHQIGQLDYLMPDGRSIFENQEMPTLQDADAGFSGLTIGLRNWRRFNESSFTPYIYMGDVYMFVSRASFNFLNDISLAATNMIDRFTGLYGGTPRTIDGYAETNDKKILDASVAQLPYLLGGVGGSGLKTAKPGLTNFQLVQKSGQKAFMAIEGKGPQVGIARHKYASNLLKRYQGIYGDRGLKPGYRSKDNKAILDVMDDNNLMIYDWKFGDAARMSTKQRTKYQFYWEDHEIIPVHYKYPKP